MFNRDKIRELRRRRNISAEELSKKILVSQPAVTKWENRRQLPNADNVEALADFFGVPMEEFYTKLPPTSA